MPALKRKSTEGSMAKKPSLRRDTTLSLKTTDEAPPISPDPSFRNVSSSQLSPKISLKRKATLVSEGTGVYSSVTTLESGSSVGKTGSLRATSVGKDYDLIPLSTSHSKKASLGTSSDAVAALRKSVSELKELTESTPPMTRSLSKRASLSKRKSGIPSDTLSSTSPPLPPGGLIEIVISFDTTGSMYSCLEEVRGRIQDMVQRLQADIPGIRISVIAHGDYCDASNYIIKWIDFGATVPELCDFVKTVSLTTGGDADECYELVLRRAREVLSWTPGSQRSLVIIGDSGPHEVGYKYRDFVNDIDWRVEATELKKMGVRIYSVVVNAIPIPFYQHISHLTGGQVISLPRFGFIFDLLMSICYKESGPELFEAYEAEAKEKNKDEELDTILDGIFSTLGDRFGTGPSSGFPSEGPPSSKPVTDPDFSLQLKPLRPMGGGIFSPGISSTPEGEKAGKATKTTKAYKAEDGKSGFGMGPSSGFPIFAPPIFTPMSTPGFPAYKAEDGKSGFGMGPSSGFAISAPPFPTPMSTPGFPVRPPYMPVGGGICPPGTSSSKVPKRRKLGKATKTSKAYKAEDGKSGFGMGPSSGFAISAPPFPTPMSTPGFPVPPAFMPVGGGICPPGTSSSKVPKRGKLGKATKTSKAYKAEDGKSEFGMGPSSGFAISAPPFPTPMSTPGFPVPPAFMPVGGGICPPGTSSSKVPKRGKLGKATKTSKKITQSRGLVNRESLTDTKFTTGPLKRLMWSKWMVGITKTSTASPGSKLVRRDWCGGYCNAGILESKDVVGVPAVYEIGIRLYGKRKIYPVFYKVTTGVPKGNSWFNYLLSKKCSAVKEVLNSHADVMVRKGQFKRKGVAFIHNVTQLLSKKYDYAWEGRRDRKMKSRNLKRCGVKISSDSY
ncbi:uncharacterized protein [Argopecten irradians]|uniref:uncharacterized protein isoform X1 n=1 Tax=Argopecten irradians TaxID=31199 RepID=UPI0037127681